MLETSQLSNFFDSFLSEPKQYIDLHIHTKASDGLINLAFLEKFLHNTSHLISITDHNEIKNNLKLYYNSKINIVPGIEVGCKDGFELLIYFKNDTDLIDFYNKNVKPYKNKYKITRTKQTHDYYLKQAKKYDSFISIPHIYGLAQKNYLNNKEYIHQVIPQVNAIETYNHAIPKKRNTLAKKIRKAKNKSATFGSDAHIEKEVISFYKLQANNNKFSKFGYLKKNFYNFCSIIALFGKHINHLIDFY